MAKELKKVLKAAVLVTAPVFFGYIFAGAAFGLLLQRAGYNFIWAFFCGLIVYAGSMQFILVDLLASGTGLIQVAIITLVVQIRHAFYGLSLIEKFKNLGKRKPYMIFALTDETYSLLCSVNPPEGVNKENFYFVITLLNHLYWISGGVIGATIGEMIPFNSTGIEFAMTALFIVIFTEQWLTAESHIPTLAGIACAIGCLMLFGTEGFLPPALLLTALVLLLGRRRIEADLAVLTEKEDA